MLAPARVSEKGLLRRRCLSLLGLDYDLFELAEMLQADFVLAGEPAEDRRLGHTEPLSEVFYSQTSLSCSLVKLLEFLSHRSYLIAKMPPVKRV
jgi:hypothetical protein